MAKPRIPAGPAAETAPPPPTRGGAFERTEGGELRPIEESAEREKPAPAAEPQPAAAPETPAETNKE